MYGKFYNKLQKEITICLAIDCFKEPNIDPNIKPTDSFLFLSLVVVAVVWLVKGFEF